VTLWAKLTQEGEKHSEVRTPITASGDGIPGYPGRGGQLARNVEARPRQIAIKRHKHQPVKSWTETHEPWGDGVRIMVSGERMDGTAIRSSYTVKYDGKDYPVPGARWDTIAMRQLDANTFTIEIKKTGSKLHMKATMVISSDGKMMTVAGKGTDDEGKPMSNTVVYRRQ
jgi:hypothetical protein